MPHKPNHNLLQNLKFSGSPSDATRTNVDPTSYMPKMKSTMRQSTLMDDPDAMRELSRDLAEGLTTPLAGTVKGIQQGAKLVDLGSSGKRVEAVVNKFLPRQGNWDNKTWSKTHTIWEANKKIEHPSVTKLFPKATHEKGKFVMRDKEFALTHNITPFNMRGFDGSTIFKGSKHSMSIRPHDKFKYSDNLANLSFDLVPAVSNSGKKYNKLANFNFYVQGQGSTAHSGKILSNLFKRMGDTPWVAKEDLLTMDSFYVLTRNVLKQGKEIVFNPGGRQKRITLGSGTYSPLHKALMKGKAQGRDEEEVLDEITRQFFKQLRATGKMVGEPMPQIHRTARGTGAPPRLSLNHFTIKSFKGSLAAMLGVKLTNLDQYLSELDKQNAR